MDLISVIVPVYKVEAYLDQCVSSIVNQTYRNLEIILVDDGSPDNCPAMCDAWAQKDSRIKVIHKENGGAGAARNHGLDTARGTYIAFADSDDYLEPEMYSHLYSLMRDEVDIVECDYLKVRTEYVEFSQKNAQIREFSVGEALQEHIRNRVFCQIIWNKLYRREVVGDVRFPVGKQIDDEFFTYQVLGNAEKLIHSQRVCYAYRQQPESVMHKLSPMNRLQAVEAKSQRHSYLLKKFPELVPFSLVDLWFTCIYQGQVAMRSPGDNQNVIQVLRKTLEDYPLGQLPGELSLMHRMWLLLAKVSFEKTCKFRNRLRVGL